MFSWGTGLHASLPGECTHCPFGDAVDGPHLKPQTGWWWARWCSLDNIDVEAATARGVMVVNAPESNVLSAAEHTIGMMLAMARNIPQAHGALKSGRWERSRWEGIELAGKTLGIVGLGRIGKLVAYRALAFDMRLIGYDPYISEERARLLNVEMMSLDQLVERADVLTVHHPKTQETTGLINLKVLRNAKPTLRIIMSRAVASLMNLICLPHFEMESLRERH